MMAIKFGISSGATWQVARVMNWQAEPDKEILARRENRFTAVVRWLKPNVFSRAHEP